MSDRPADRNARRDSNVSDRATLPAVLVVAPQPFYEDRGTPIAVGQLVKALAGIGYGVDVLTYPVGQPFALAGVEIFRASNPLRIRHVPIGFSARKLALDVTLVTALARRLRVREYACVHAVEEAAFPAAWLAQRRKIPLIYDMQSSLPAQLANHAVFRGRFAQRVLLSWERWLLRSATAVMTSSGLARHVRSDTTDVPVKEWSYPANGVAPPGADAALIRAELAIPEGAPIVLYTGTFEAYQGLASLVAGIPRVRAEVPDVVFVLIGADPEGLASVGKQARALGLTEAIRLLERQPRARIPLFLNSASVLVSPRSHGENLPLKIYDYMAAGKPIVATDIPPHRTVLDGDLALLVAPDSDSIAEGIILALSDPARAACLAAAAGEYAEQHFGWMAFVRSVAELYDEICFGSAVD